MLALLCSVLQAAPALVAPMYLENTPPPVRCAQHILLTPRASTDEADQVLAWSELEAETRALLARLRAGADFGAEAAQVLLQDGIVQCHRGAGLEVKGMGLHG